MVITVDRLVAEPLFEQVRRQVIVAIATGELRPGDALPSVRSLARDLGINLHTVHKAYETLAAQGYVLLLGRRGAFVADAASESTAGLDAATLRAGLTRLATELSASGGTPEEFLAQARDVTKAVWPAQASSSSGEDHRHV